MNEFDITLTYAAGDHVLYDDQEYIYKPQDWHFSFSIGVLPIYGNGWFTKESYDLIYWDDAPKITYKVAHFIESIMQSVLRKHATCDYTFEFDPYDNEPTVLDCKDKMINEI